MLFVFFQPFFYDLIRFLIVDVEEEIVFLDVDSVHDTLDAGGI